MCVKTPKKNKLNDTLAQSVWLLWAVIADFPFVLRWKFNNMVIAFVYCGREKPVLVKYLRFFTKNWRLFLIFCSFESNINYASSRFSLLLIWLLNAQSGI